MGNSGGVPQGKDTDGAVATSVGPGHSSERPLRCHLCLECRTPSVLCGNCTGKSLVGLHFADKETEAQSKGGTCSGHVARDQTSDS